MFDWDDLRVFLTVARTKRVAQAARVLGIDVTTINRRLSRLSQALDADLFEQAGGERVMTERGLALFRHAESAEGAALAAIAEVKGERHSLSGHVRLSVPEGFGNWILVPGLPAFHRQHPGIQLDLVTGLGFLNPSKREADMAVMLARPKTGHLFVQKLADYRLHLYASTEYLQSRPPVAGRSDLGLHTLIGYVPEFTFSPELDYLDEVHAGLEAVLRSSSIIVQLKLVLGGAGIGVLPDFIAAQDDRLVRLLGDDVEINRSFWLVTHREMARLARTEAVSELLRRQTASILSADTETADGSS